MMELVAILKEFLVTDLFRRENVSQIYKKVIYIF